jgi:hypothetical protein
MFTLVGKQSKFFFASRSRQPRLIGGVTETPFLPVPHVIETTHQIVADLSSKRA